jgi:hypothetical protein
MARIGPRPGYARRRKRLLLFPGTRATGERVKQLIYKTFKWGVTESNRRPAELRQPVRRQHAQLRGDHAGVLAKKSHVLGKYCGGGGGRVHGPRCATRIYGCLKPGHRSVIRAIKFQARLVLDLLEFHRASISVQGTDALNLLCGLVVHFGVVGRLFLRRGLAGRQHEAERAPKRPRAHPPNLASSPRHPSPPISPETSLGKFRITGLDCTAISIPLGASGASPGTSPLSACIQSGSIRPRNKRTSPRGA